MAPKNLTLKIALSLAAFLSTTTIYASMKNLQMTVGESMPITFPTGTELKISKKGVLDVFLTNETTWQLTALRPGLVIIDAVDGTSGSSLFPRLFVDVKSEAKEGELSLITMDLPEWICSKRGVKCDSQAGIIKGKTSDWQWYIRTTSWCNTSKNCHSFLEMNENAFKSLEAYLQVKLGKTFSIKSDQHGNTSISSICDSYTQEQQARRIESLIPGILDKHIASFSCAQSQTTYEVRIKARRISTTAGKIVGYKSEASHQIKGLPISSVTSLKNSLVNESLSTEGEIVGEPMFLASEEVEFQALVGGELPYLTQKEQKSDYQWKEYGLSVKGKIKGIQDGRIRTHLDLFLKSLNDENSGSLSTSSLKSSVDTAESTWTLVGELDLKSSSSNLRETLFLVSVPIIGPFFKLMSSTSDNSKLQVWLQIKKLRI
jgi:hypothetical protein